MGMIHYCDLELMTPEEVADMFVKPGDRTPEEEIEIERRAKELHRRNEKIFGPTPTVMIRTLLPSGEWSEPEETLYDDDLENEPDVEIIPGSYIERSLA